MNYAFLNQKSYRIETEELFCISYISASSENVFCSLQQRSFLQLNCRHSSIRKFYFTQTASLEIKHGGEVFDLRGGLIELLWYACMIAVFWTQSIKRFLKQFRAMVEGMELCIPESKILLH